jgi:hypothetical protein
LLIKDLVETMLAAIGLLVVLPDSGLIYRQLCGQERA